MAGRRKGRRSVAAAAFFAFGIAFAGKFIITQTISGSIRASEALGSSALNSIVTVMLSLTMIVIMFSLGLGLVVGDFARIITEPKAFAVALLSKMLVMPVAGVAVAVGFNLPADMAFGLTILALCPGGATSNILTKIAHGDVALSISANAVSTLLAVFTMPILVKLMADYFLGVEAAQINVTGLGLSMLALTTVPVVVGLVLRHFAENLALAIERPIAKMAMGLVVLVVGGALIINWEMFVDNLPTLAPSVIVLNIALLIIGVLLARLFSLSESQATAIALETGIQNAALGITVGSLIVENGNEVSAFSVPSGVYGITMYAICVAFTFWRRRRALALAT